MYKTKIDQKRFDAVKIMIDSGAVSSEIEKYMGISAWSVTAIKKAATYDEYKNMLAAIALERKKKKESKKAEDSKHVSIQEHHPNDHEPKKEPTSINVMKENYQLSRLYDEQRKTNELLTSISSKLAFIVEELAGVPAAK